MAGAVDRRYWVPFMFRNELDMLECMLYEHYDRVYRFVLAEAAVNHQGRPKPLFYEENKERFAQYADKIVHIVVPLPDPGQCSDPWVRERAQRDACLGAIVDAGGQDNDIVVNVDVDEIPSALALQTVPEPLCGLMLRYHPFAVDYQGSPGANGTMCLLEKAKSIGSLSSLRMMKDIQPPPYPIIDPGGWHLSWLGGQDEIREKLFSYCHLETFEATMEANEADVMYRTGRGSPIADPVDKVEVDETWPRWIAERKCPESWFRPR